MVVRPCGNLVLVVLRDKELERSVASVAAVLNLWAKVSGLPKEKSDVS